MATTAVRNYRLYCNVESAWFTTWREDVVDADNPPTLCPNCLSANIRDISIIDTIKANDVEISTVAVGLKLPVKDIDFPDRTGHNVFEKGYTFVADQGVTTEHEASYNQWMKMTGLRVEVDENAYPGDNVEGSEGDYVEVEIVDVLGVTGYPPGTVLAKFAETIFVKPNRIKEKACLDAKTIPPTCVIRVRYVSRGSFKVRVNIEHMMRTMPQP